MFYIGCPMWGYKEWVGTGKLFPPRTPAKEFLRLYSRKLSTVEGNTIFYAIPNEEVIRRWAQETPATFRFCPKVARTISHEGDIATKKAATLAFVERMRLLGERLGPVFLQLPPTFTPTDLPSLETFLTFWPTDVRLAVEVRHAGFFSEKQSSALNTVLTQHHVARVILDTRPIRVGPLKEQRELQARERKPDLPLCLDATSDLLFVRYIGHPRTAENAPFLTFWAQQIGQWLTQGRTIYAFCHCPFEEHSPAICAELYRRVAALVPLPPLPWATTSENTAPEQFRLF